MKRSDAHRPSVIEPEDYEYVAEEFMDVKSLGDALCLKAQHEIIAAHQAKTGGKYSQHEHGGNCMVCGSVNAIYTSLFYHQKTSSYVRMGHDCADKCECGGEFARKQFRRQVEDAREFYAGKAKAKSLLSDYGLSACWDIYSAENRDGFQWEEVTITDIISKFIRYGSISEKQQDFLRKLLAKIPARAEIAAQREAEKVNAADCPSGRILITGIVLGTKNVESMFGTSMKMLVQDETGFKVFGSRIESVGKGDAVKFTATIEPSTDDKKFGFFKRPVIFQTAEEKAAEKAERKRIAALYESNSSEEVSRAL